MAVPEIQHNLPEPMRLLSAVLDRFPEHVAVLDHGGRIVVVNQAWIDFGRANGAPPTVEWVGVDYLAACRDTEGRWLENASEASEGIRAILAGVREELETEYPCEAPHETRWFRLNASGFDYADTRWVVVTHTNITDIRRLVEAATTSDFHFRNLVENALTGVLNATLDGEITFVNQALARMFEFDTPEEMRLEGMLPRWRHPEGRQEFILRLKQQGYVDNYEMDAVTRTGKLIYTLSSATLNGDEISAIVMNITERRQAEEQIRTYQNRLQALAWQLTLAEERERRRIALELHDQVGQSLTFMRMQLAAAQKESGGRKVAAILAEVSDSLRQAIQDTRDVISDLSPPVVNELGLSAAIGEWLREQIEDRYGLQSQLIDDGEPKPLSEDTKAILYRNVRELLMNIVKHANARKIRVSIQREGAAVQIVVADDGVGLGETTLPDRKIGDSGFGLFSIDERMKDLGGSLAIASSPGQGFRATLTAPLDLRD